MAITQFRRALCPALLFALVGGVANGQAPTNNQIATRNSVVDSSAADRDRPQLAQRNPRYRINRSDVLNLTFPLSPEFNQTVTVQPDGFITLQVAGSISILGMTVPETSEAIKKAYARILHDPIIDVDLKDFQKAYFIVTGQVTKPGQYDLRYDLTASEAIAIAGGFMPTAKTQIYLYHRSAEAGFRHGTQAKDFLHGNIEEDVQIRPGDMIFVPEKRSQKFASTFPIRLAYLSIHRHSVTKHFRNQGI